MCSFFFGGGIILHNIQVWIPCDSLFLKYMCTKGLSTHSINYIKQTSTYNLHALGHAGYVDRYISKTGLH